MAEQEIDHIIWKVLSNEATPQEKKALDKWASLSEANKVSFEEMKAAWSGTKFREDYGNQAAVFSKINHQINEWQPDTIGPRIGRNSNWKRYIGIAASIVVVFMVVFVLYHLGPEGSAGDLSTAEMVNKSNPAGQKSKIFLPDGSTAWLNAESHIQYLRDFTDSSRDVYLDGEAYFNVAHDAARPFRVHAGGMEVTALGTIFNVRSFDDDHQTLVSLIQGKVGVQARNFYEVINPGEGISLDHEANSRAGSISKVKVDVAREVAWKDGVLIFDGQRIGAIVRTLEQWYGVDIDVQGSPDQNAKYYGKFKNENLENVLTGMQYGKPFKFEIKGRKVKITFAP